MHINVVAENYAADIENVIEPYIYEKVQEMSGSISAEHGLGVMKPDKIGYTKDPLSVHYMKQIKRLFDPQDIMNPYKYLPKENYLAR